MINRINVTIGSSTINKFIDLSLSQPFDSHHLLDLHIKVEDVKEVLEKDIAGQLSLREVTQLWAGEKITVKIMQGEVDTSSNFQQKTSLVFIGIITSIQLQMKDAIDNTVVVSGVSPTILFSTGNNTRSFSEMSLSNIVSEVISPFKGFLKAYISPDFSERIGYITQYQEDNYHFLQRLAETYGEWFYYDGEQFIFGKSSRVSSSPASLEYGSNLTQLEYELKLVPMLFKGKHYGYVQDEVSEIKSRDEKAELQDHAQTAFEKSESLFSYENLDISFQSSGSNSALQNAVKNKKSESGNKLAVIKGTSTSLEMRVGSPVTIKDDIIENGNTQRTDDYGLFVVTNIRHYVDSRGFYQNSFEAIPQDIAYPPVDYRIFQPKAETQPAKVVDTNDPEQMGRVKVQFYWQKNGESTPWARVANLMSGDESGVYFIPEVDEVVFVDFEMGNPDIPFVRGSMFTGRALPGSELFQSENNFKGIITRSGNSILIDDSSGKEQIRIYNPESRNEVLLSMDNEPHIEIKSDGKIKIEAKEIELKAEKISMNAQQDWTVETNKGSIEAKAKMQITGATVNVEGKSQTIIKGNAQLALEGGAQASLKAAMVMIN
ncbi:type VI secretion system Vgr family protein [Dyadobacter sp. CY351]|uniref:type VI secretion system Vgr family protein n=1 Tax=Dyadobacter sp. CY351 TaxID=2909337 RepID=UPI001F29CC5A|nr:type VI secretion system tip protein VgrG [Dyadobacter sp. CY351]MCF2518553.1 type VI secretion system tip protein VgrG [Dyadobacter sp. CY351]